jgi:peptidoglycan-N-acetylglucosamine deacetylase
MYLKRIPGLLPRLFSEWEWHTSEGTIALTFDDGPHPESTEALLLLLDRLKISTTHFLSGSQVLDFPEGVHQIRQKGHAIGHHGFHHLNGWKTPPKKYLQDILKAYEIIGGNLFRPPYGKIKPAQWTALQARVPSLRCIQFSLMPGDFDLSMRPQDILKHLMTAEGGDIVVLHDTPDSFKKYAPVLEEWVVTMHQKGLRFVTL